MPKFRYDGDEPRIYAEQPYALGEVFPGDEHDLRAAPDERWAKATSTPPKQAKAAKKAAAPRRQAQQEAAEEAALPADQPTAQPPETTPDA